MSEKNVKKNNAGANVKKRNWAFVLYPESAPKDWVEQLRQSGIQCAISPLHDKDVDPTGTPKKAHYHIILVYGNPTTFNNVKSFTNGKLGQTIPQPLEQVRGYYRYLTHEDNPEKVQYSKADIQTLNGFDISDFCEMSKSEVTKITRDIVAFVRENDIDEYSELIEIIVDAGETLANWFEVARSNTLFFRGYIESRRFRKYRASGGGGKS